MEKESENEQKKKIISTVSKTLHKKNILIKSGAIVPTLSTTKIQHHAVSVSAR